MEIPKLSIDQLAEKLNVPKTWIYSRTRIKGPEAIPCLRVGKYIRFSEEEVFDWLKAQQN